MVESMQDDRDFLKTNPVVKLVDLGLSEYALTIVAEYADVEVSACRRCHGWGCRPGPCRDIPTISTISGPTERAGCDPSVAEPTDSV